LIDSVVAAVVAGRIEKNFLHFAHREADVIASFPVEIFTSAGRFW
jgi:hypothetical protein